SAVKGHRRSPTHSAEGPAGSPGPQHQGPRIARLLRNLGWQYPPVLRLLGWSISRLCSEAHKTSWNFEPPLTTICCSYSVPRQRQLFPGELDGGYRSIPSSPRSSLSPESLALPTAEPSRLKAVNRDSSSR